MEKSQNLETSDAVLELHCMDRVKTLKIPRYNYKNTLEIRFIR